jgi:hypothetical protein
VGYDGVDYGATLLIKTALNPKLAVHDLNQQHE